MTTIAIGISGTAVEELDFAGPYEVPSAPARSATRGWAELDGRPATTHWSALDRLAAAGIDMALHPDRAARLAGNRA